MAPDNAAPDNKDTKPQGAPAEGQPGTGKPAAPAPEPKGKDVPEQNRIAEMQRKLAQERREREQLQAQVNALNAKLTETSASPDEQQMREWKDAVRKEAREELTEQTRKLNQLNAIVDEIIEAEPIAKRYRAELIGEMMQLSSDLWTKPHVIEDRAFSIVGRHAREITAEQDKDRDKDKQPEGAVLESTPGSGAPARITLTPDEENEAERHDLYSKGYTPQEIREFVDKRKKANKNNKT